MPLKLPKMKRRRGKGEQGEAGQVRLCVRLCIGNWHGCLGNFGGMLPFCKYNEHR